MADCIDYVLAIAIFCTPRVYNPDGPIDCNENVQQIMRRLAIEWELDSEDIANILFKIPLSKTHPEYTWLKADDVISRYSERFQNLLDAPCSNEIIRFPDDRSIAMALNLNNQFNNYLNEFSYADFDRIAPIKKENSKLHIAWERLRMARLYSTYGDMYTIRTSLKALKQAIGEEAFQRGIMPPYVPLWRFRYIDN